MIPFYGHSYKIHIFKDKEFESIDAVSSESVNRVNGIVLAMVFTSRLSLCALIYVSQPHQNGNKGVANHHSWSKFHISLTIPCCAPNGSSLPIVHSLPRDTVYYLKFSEMMKRHLQLIYTKYLN